MILTFITVPFIIVIEHLRHSEMFKTILQGDFSSIFIHSSLLHFLLGGAHPWELLDEGIFKISMPKNVQDQVSLTLWASVKANVILNSNFMQGI